MTVIALCGGGTAGHITPLLAVGEELTAAHPEVSLLVVGTSGGREAELLPEGFADIIEVSRLPFPRRLNADALRFPGRFMATVRQLRREFRTRGVTVVAGFGGYVAAPAYVAAWLEKIPLVIHEANAIPGLANRLGARLTPWVATCFPGTPLAGHRTVGMPLPRHIVTMDRAALAASSYQFFGLRDDVPVLLITGGSSGAKRLNDAIVRRVPEIIAQGWQVLHVVGPTLPAPEDTPRGYVAVDYCRRMDWAYSVADVVIARAGAATVSELAIAGLPSVLVPYHVGNGEQQKNARYLVDAGAALTVSQEKFDDAYIDTVVMGLLRDKSARDEMSQAAKSVAIVDAAAQVAAMVWSAGLGASADVDAP